MNITLKRLLLNKYLFPLKLYKKSYIIIDFEGSNSEKLIYIYDSKFKEGLYTILFNDVEINIETLINNYLHKIGKKEKKKDLPLYFE